MGPSVASLVMDMFLLLYTSLLLLGVCCPMFFSLPQLFNLCVSWFQFLHQFSDCCHLLRNFMWLCFDDVLVFWICGFHVDLMIILLLKLILRDCICAVKTTLLCGGFLETSYFLLALMKFAYNLVLIFWVIFNRSNCHSRLRIVQCWRLLCILRQGYIDSWLVNLHRFWYLVHSAHVVWDIWSDDLGPVPL